MSEEVLFYDLPAKDGKAWSLNPWKTRLYLNYKGIPYKTQWIEYPDLKPTLEKALHKSGVPPNETGLYSYTSPTIRLPSGEYFMESRKIAFALEPLYKEPPLHLDSPVLPRVETLLPKIVERVRPAFAPLVPKVFLNPVSRDYFVQSREKGLKQPLDEFAKGADRGFEEAAPYVKELADVLREKPEGPFFLGKEVSYADFLVVGWLHMFVRLSIADKIWALEGGEDLKALYDASAKWLERDSY
ncbi:hypothetical protein LTR84_006199 [Exophiala bonariae]|uniref:GST N-terminal domain-containing protein n=1 Tax=Exophiala bonariae TaxID=1690606 RepID=A0AAV9N2K8_9EURO|nr:hypothetical protein LTR84_006199 [Exophiala bonariae]